MAKDKLNNLLDFTEYSELKKFDKSTKRTEIGGDVVQEKKKELPEFIKKKIEEKEEGKDKKGCKVCPGKKESKEDKPKGKKMSHIKEFNEYSDAVDEGLFSPNKKTREEALQIINSHPAKKANYEKLPNDKKELYVQFFMNNPGANYVKWDDEKGSFVDAAVYTAKSGPGGTGFH